MSRTFELASWHEVSPNEHGEFAGMCMVTGHHGPGIVIKGYEPVDANVLFVGEQVILEAFAALMDSTPKEVKRRFGKFEEDKQTIRDLQDRVDVQEAMISQTAEAVNELSDAFMFLHPLAETEDDSA